MASKNEVRPAKSEDVATTNAPQAPKEGGQG